MKSLNRNIDPINFKRNNKISFIAKEEFDNYELCVFDSIIQNGADLTPYQFMRDFIETVQCDFTFERSDISSHRGSIGDWLHGVVDMVSDERLESEQSIHEYIHSSRHAYQAIERAIQSNKGYYNFLSELDEEDLDYRFVHACRNKLLNYEELRAANWKYWLSVASWDLEEALALVFGKDPIAIHTTKKLPDWARFALDEFESNMLRHIGANNLTIPVKPESFAKWISEFHQFSHAALKNRVASSKMQNSKSDYQLHHHTRANLQRVLLYLAVEHYDYDVNKAIEATGSIDDANGGVGKRSVAAQIGHDLVARGMPISTKTLNQMLRDAVTSLTSGEHKNIDVQTLRKRKAAK